MSESLLIFYLAEDLKPSYSIMLDGLQRIPRNPEGNGVAVMLDDIKNQPTGNFLFMSSIM